MEQGTFQREKVRVREAQRAGACQQKGSKTTLSLTALLWVVLESGKHVVDHRSVVQLSHDEELGPLHGMYGSMEAELEVQRTNKRAELTAFVCLLRRFLDLSRSMSTTKEL